LQVDWVDTTLTELAFGDIRVWPAKGPGYLDLRHPCRVTRSPQSL
jgi:hypothetical protein